MLRLHRLRAGPISYSTPRTMACLSRASACSWSVSRGTDPEQAGTHDRPQVPPTVRNALARTCPGSASPATTNRVCCSNHSRHAARSCVPHRFAAVFSSTARAVRSNWTAPPRRCRPRWVATRRRLSTRRNSTMGSEPWVVEYHRRLQEGGKPLPERVPKAASAHHCAGGCGAPDLSGGVAVQRSAGGEQYRQIGNAVPPRPRRGCRERVSLRRCTATRSEICLP